MKEIEQEQTKQAKEIVVPIPDKQRFLGQLIKINGLKVWEYNIKEDTMREAQFEDVTVNVTDKGVRRKLVIKSDCIYTQALNVKNAERKFSKKLAQMIMTGKIKLKDLKK